MAIGKCRECGKDVSTEAKTCPHCGASNPIEGSVGRFTTAIAICLAAFVGIKCSSTDDTPADPVASNVRTYTPSKEHTAGASNARYMCSEFVKRGAHDPSSLDWDRRFEWPAREYDDGVWEVGMRFRAKNGFGATVLNVKTCRIKVSGENASLMSLE